MAILITNANSNIIDTTLSYSLTFTGRTGAYAIASIIVNGTEIAATAGLTSPITVTYSASALYNAAAGFTRTGAVTFRVKDMTEFDTVISSSDKTGGLLTVNYRLTGFTLTEPSTTGGREWIMDNTTGNTLTSSWSRTNAAFYARLKGYVYNHTSATWVLVFNRYGYTTSSNTDIDALGYHDAIVAEMDLLSPADFRLQLVTQFNDGTADYEDLSLTGTTSSYQLDKTGSIIYHLYDLATIAISNVTLYSSTTTIPFTLTEPKALTYTVNLYTRKSAVDTLIRTETSVTASGNFTIGATERTAILNALLPSTSGTIWASVTTETYGTTDSTGTATTLTIDASMLGAPVVLSFDSSLHMRVLSKLVESGTDITLTSAGILTVPKIIEGTTVTIDSTKNLTVVKLIEGEA